MRDPEVEKRPPPRGFDSHEAREREVQKLAAEMGVTPERLKQAVQAAPFSARAQRRILRRDTDRRFKL